MQQDPWMDNMLNGNFAEAWEHSDAVLQAQTGISCWHLPRHQQYLWDGKPLNGKKVLVRCYHGLGDTLQFIRYIPQLRAIANEVIVWAQPALIPLLGSVTGIDKLLPLNDGTPDAEYDADIEIMELPHIFKTSLDTIPDDVPYIDVPAMRPAKNDKPAIGLVWRAGGWDDQRSVPFAALQPVFDMAGLQVYILQENALAAGWKNGY